MTNTNSSDSTTLTKNLLVIVLIVSILLTALAIYDIAKDDHGLSVWVAIICWPVVAIANGIKLFNLRKKH